MTWFCREIGLNKTTSSLIGINTLITIEATQIESGYYQGYDHLADLIFGGYGVWLANETETFKMKFEK